MSKNYQRKKSDETMIQFFLKKATKIEFRPLEEKKS